MSEEGAASLSYAVRPRVVAKYLGQLALVLAALNLLPLAVALVYGEFSLAARLAAVTLGLVGLAAVSVRQLVPGRIQVNEALVVTAAAFVLAALAMSYPFMATGLGFIDALFEAVSGVTTTGLSTVSAVENRPAGFLFARAWMQWYGGLGFAVLSLALLAGHQAAYRQLLDPEMEAGAEHLATTTRLFARRVLAVYIVLTLTGIALMLLLGNDAFIAVTHVLAAVSTGGFSSLNASLGGMSPLSAVTLTLIATSGAVALPLYYLAKTRGVGSLLADTELRWLVMLVALVSLAVALSLLARGMAPAAAVMNGFILGASAQTTTGFSSLDVGSLGAGTQWVLVLAMLVGGSMGSTAGGIKLFRLVIIWRRLSMALRRTAMPEHAVVESKLGQRRLEADDVERALLTLVMFLLVIAVSALLFMAAGYDPLESLFEVVSATATVGLSTGITSETLSPLLKGVLCLDMLAGRVEVLALLVLLYPHTWFGKRMKTS